MAWRATSPSEWPWRRGAPAISTPPSSERRARPERMAVVPDPRAHRAAPAEERLGAGEVVGHRHLEIDRVAGHDADRYADRLEQRGLVGPGLGPVGREAAKAARSRSRRTPCGVWAAPSPVRSTVSPTTSPSIRLSVSATGRTGIAAPCRAASAATRPRGLGVTSGRAPSWTRTTPCSSAPKPLERRRTRRRPTPGDARRRRRRRPPLPGSHGRRGNLAPVAPARSTTTIRSTSGAADDRVERPGEQRPAAELGGELVGAAHPGRPAGGDDDRVGTDDRSGHGRVRRAGRRRPLNRGAAGRRSSARRRSGARG